MSQFRSLNVSTIWGSEWSHNLSFKFCQNLWFCVWSHFEFLGFVAILVEFCNIVNFVIYKFLLLSHFDFLLFVLSLLNFLCHNLSFGVLSQFEFLIFVKIRYFFIPDTIWVLSQWVFKLCHNLSCWVLSQFEFLNFNCIQTFITNKFSIIFFIMFFFSSLLLF